LISEAVRGAGARLTDQAGKPFMQKYYPELKKPDLTTRDKVSRAIFTEMLNTGSENVYLDLRSYISAAQIQQDFPVIYQTCLSYGIDITTDLVPVSPAAHYACGGILTDLTGLTTLPNLYAVGEVACTGLHGANRLASTSLLEGLVFGNQAAINIHASLPQTKLAKPAAIKPWQDSSKYQADSAVIAADINTIGNIMWNMVGLVRKTYLLQRAITDLTKLEDTVTKFYRQAKLTDELLGLRNMVLVALLTAKSALANPHSAGCHYRED
jgi:L-aspartate oxidase